MRIIKKYGNRRLYDTEKSAYINLDELAALIRSGQQVKILAAKGGQDLTREVLLQVVLENLQGGELLSESMLHRIIRSTGDDPWQLLLRKQLAAGMEMLSTQMDQVERMFTAAGAGAPPPGSAAHGAANSGAAASASQASPTEAECGPGPESEIPEAVDPPVEPQAAPSPPPPREDSELDALRARLAALEERLSKKV